LKRKRKGDQIKETRPQRVLCLGNLGLTKRSKGLGERLWGEVRHDQTERTG